MRPAGHRDYLAENQILSYYGNPYATGMGILGELEPEELVSRLLAHAAEYDALNGEMGVRPALHIVWATAQASEGREGTYLLYVDKGTMREYIDLACRKGLLVFIDLQIGRSDVATEVEKALPFLEQPHVHLALDPEFAMPPGEVPGEAIGTLDAEDVNTAQRMVQEFAEERGLQRKGGCGAPVPGHDDHASRSYCSGIRACGWSSTWTDSVRRRSSA